MKNSKIKHTGKKFKANPSDPGLSTNLPQAKIKGKTKAKHAMIAALIARGSSVKEVADKVNLSKDQIYHLLSDKDSFVNLEISRILSELFGENDLRLIDLYSKTLQKLDNMLSSSDEEKQLKAMDRIIKTFLAKWAKNRVTVQQYFGIESQEEKETVDQMIMHMRKERGLPMWPDYLIRDMISDVRKERRLPELSDDYMQDIFNKLVDPNLPFLPDHEDSSNSTEKDSSHSPAKNSTSGNSPQDASSQDTTSQDPLPKRLLLKNLRNFLSK